ncbi:MULTISPECIES: DUF6879 family protein [unclassified Streptomyces]|uniref:DUF6879 family protein n=1 Tax=unclassified Streptomyces TaxID=2593676 RepID=UPI0006ADBC2E|nr:MULTISPECIES: DUF6879 family protein [unclassified Streptomyces]KOX21109.1 hypothetical protein ADL06_26570 [Streptomyces sp. NRRL F-6491]KOX41107.1 hypothetical protein ADL08_20395 [Streptomyces sp. NRRL F-6492]
MPSSAPDFAESLGRCERPAVHLELRDAYAPTDRFEAWRRGGRIDWDDRTSWWHPYDQLVADTVARGVSTRRARIVSEPLSDYVRYEYDGTFTNVAAGEDVQRLPRSRARDLPFPAPDGWVVDERTVIPHHFDGEGRWTGPRMEVLRDPEPAAR